jgi:hypothetical protein
MDGLVLKALEKDRDNRWQSMAELLEAVGVCPGPETAAPKLPGGQTVAMGGAHAAAALKILRAKGTETSRVSRKAVDSALSSADMEAQPNARARGKTLVLVVVGILLGVAVAAWFALSHGKTQPQVAPPPTAVAPPSPPAVVPPPPVPPAPQPAAALPEPAIAPSPAAEGPSPEPTAKRESRGHRVKTPPATAKHVAPGTSPAAAPPVDPVAKPAPPATPGELKPFPKL